ncbi:MAG: hypothetical protein HW388_48 [Dehalococcoidia bacterium]|nr:hypothetical protein [Dehalococcoidia bacterium]
MDNLWYLTAAFSIAWIIILGYVLVLARRQARLQESTHYLEGLIQEQEGR